MIKLYQGDCLEIMPTLAAGSADMVLCDLPYGCTQNKWDSVLPLAPLWRHYVRVCRGAVVLTSSQPFTSQLVTSALMPFRYEWVWEKSKATGHLNCKRQPLKAHENVLVFSLGAYPYIPQKSEGLPYKGAGGKSRKDNYGDFAAVREGSPDGTRYPRTVLRCQHEAKPEHPTQKPVALMEYLIKTYTNPGDTVLDNCMGSGTTGVACVNTGRNFIGIEMDEKYFAIAEKRINDSTFSAQKNSDLLADLG